MARSCGIRIGSRRAELLVLDGSPRKPKLVGYEREAIELDEDGNAILEGVGDQLKGMAKGLADKIGSDGTQLVLDSGAAVYRHLSLPFADKAKIEEVLNFEVESKIPQWDIDATICDFHMVSGTPVESHLLVSAAPKKAIADRIEACRSAGLEPIDAELDATALFTAAEFAQVFSDETAQLLVYLGDGSATLVVVSGGELIGTRAFHFEPEPVGPKLATAGADGDGDGESAFEREDDEDLLGQRAARRKVHVTRLRREIARTLNSVSTENRFDAIWMCGNNTAELLSEPIGDVEVRLLDPLADVPGAEEIEDRGAAVVAFGAALRRLGFESAVTPHLRREELAFAGTFERLELPLGILALMLLFFVSTQVMISVDAIKKEQSKLDHWAGELQRFMVGEDPRSGRTASAALTRPPELLLDYVLTIAESDEGDPDLSRAEEFDRVRKILAGEIDNLRRRLGAAEDTSYPQSALWAATLALSTLEELQRDDAIVRFAIREIDAQYQPGNSRRPDVCEVTLDLTFFGETQQQSLASYDTFINTLRSREWLVQPDELREPARRTGQDGSSVILDGLRFFVDPGQSEVYFDDYQVPEGRGGA